LKENAHCPQKLFASWEGATPEASAHGSSEMFGRGIYS
jgi:hypothetical protein